MQNFPATPREVVTSLWRNSSLVKGVQPLEFRACLAAPGKGADVADHRNLVKFATMK